MTTTAVEVFRAIDLLGVLGNAVLGGIVARRQRMDPVGFVALAIASGLGGGLIRDTLLQNGPPIALVDYLYITMAVVGAAAAFVVPVRGRWWNVGFPIVDAVALGCWAATGSQKTLAVGLGWLPAILLGTITAVGGGALRDLLIRRTPQIFGGNTLYASCAVAASAVVVLATAHGLDSLAMVLGTGTGAALCLLARWRRWQLWQGLSWEYRVRREPGARLPRFILRAYRDGGPPHRRSPAD